MGNHRKCNALENKKAKKELDKKNEGSIRRTSS
jgi:hypothetical protein